MQPPRAIVFDLDGTLVDSSADILSSVVYALKSVGRVPGDPRRYLQFVGDGARWLCARAAGLAPDDPEVDRMAAAYVEYYASHPLDQTTWMPGMSAALAELEPFLLAVCTNKPRRPTDAILRGLGAEARFRTVVAGGDLPESKPHPRPILVIAERLGVTPGELVVVGDGPQDVEAGRQAGARTIGIVGPILGLERLQAAGPDVLLESAEELPAVIRRWCDPTVKRVSGPP